MDMVRFREKILSRIIVDEKTKCWNWQGSNVRGYGTIAEGTKSKGTWKQYYAHRVSYTIFRGDIPDGLQIDHLCRNPACINPSHLEVVSCKENIQRGEAGIANKSKTHCKHGHEFTEKNTYITKKNQRFCRECGRLKKKKEREKDPEKYNEYQREYRERNHLLS